MSVILIDGFDLYNGVGANTGLQAKWSGGAASCSLVAGRFGGQAVQAVSSNAGGRDIQRSFAATASIGIGCALRMTVMPTANNVHGLFNLLNGATYTFGLRVTTTGALEAYRLTAVNAGTSLGVSAAGVIAVNTWHYVEIGVVINDTTGSVVVKVDGATVLNLTSQDTNNAVTNADTVILGYDGGIATTLGTAQFDDFYLLDSATTIGQRRIETLYPTSDVAQGFARSAGTTNYTLVDEAQVNGDTDYVQGSSVGDVDTYGFADLGGTPTSIDAVQVSAFAEKTDAAARSIALQVKSGATTSDGSDYALAASYGKHERLLLTDPNGGGAWGAAAVNALQGGPKVTV